MADLIAPSVLSFDLPNVRGSVIEMARLGADIVHLDVMDGQFVPPITFGAAYVKSLRPVVGTLFEAHLMTMTPERHFDDFADAGCGRILFHVEATAHAHRLAQDLRERGISPGVVLNPGTPVEAALEVLDVVDMVLVMTVNPGWGGQKFLHSVLHKVARLRRERADLEIEVDGGINPTTLKLAKDHGANVFVVGNYLASAQSLPQAYQELRDVCS